MTRMCFKSDINLKGTGVLWKKAGIERVQRKPEDKNVEHIGGHLTQRSVSDNENLCPLWFVILKCI